MSQENVDLVRRAYEAFGRGDLEAALADFDPGVEIEDHELTLDTVTYQGREGFVKMVTTVNEGFEDVRYTPEDFTDAGTQVLVAVLRTGKGSASGVAVEEPQWHVFDIENQTVVKLRIFVERSEALEALGLRE